MPTKRLIVAVLVGAIASSLIWMLVVSIASLSRQTMLAGPVGAGLVAFTTLLGILVMSPWQTREISLWWTMWLASMVLRLLLTPALAFLLYSATSFSPEAMCLAVAASYFLTLGAEVVVIQNHVSSVLQPS
ncbi:MAG: hypothetical protein O7G85_13200 [Planctomycetota bacterium]|nr:hypothetical protein [Planctomycetota bacterium]